MSRALIGYTGFVGTNLCAQTHFDASFNSKNIADIAGRSFETVVCAAAPATMWAANKDPDADLRKISGLLDAISGVTAEHFVLISTIAVLGDAAAGLDETSVHFETAKAYGRNRRFLEVEVASRFPRCHILRLPALFGKGLKKNFLFDIINPVPSFLSADKFSDLMDRLPADAAAIFARVYRFSADLGMFAIDRSLLAGPERTMLTTALFNLGFTALNFTHADSTFQYYGLGRLWSDVERVISQDVPLIHLAPEPLRAADVYHALTGKDLTARSGHPYHEDMRTLHSKAWGGPDGYIQSRHDVLSEIDVFYKSQAVL
ncbi:hypothetical protein J5J86_00020 [Aquabacter sp. L1I39]|uniref:hypothetical protein n=1 Tax=Aquabacter sp. L1I39 TaxID=2820278 RepID=UPI001AD96FD9|nr:hypothetical protein [Aquabacter sp. L1I39]QTL03811.1 hypothetical protein J5J86_00020 [Aquabacter sp. L1I39]